jgi:DNA topoisomerase-3
MKYIELRPSRLHCANCNDTYSLPMDGTIRLYKEQKCPLDEFELVLCSVGTKGKVCTLCIVTVLVIVVP